MSPRPGATRYDEIREDALRVIAERVAAVRLLFGPAWLVVVLWIAVSDPEPWRRICLGALAVVGAGALLLRGLGAQGPRTRVGLGGPISIGLVCALTGGLLSPFVSFFFFLVILAHGLVPETRRGLLAVLVTLVVGLLVAAHVLDVPVVPLRFLGEDGAPSPTYYVVIGVMLALTLALVRRIAASLWDRGDEMLRQSLEARDEALEAHRERVRELSAYSAELAHELKNPLASIKGLAALAAMEPERARERLEILRGEIDRMQSILEEHLDFTRPLSPLTITELDLTTLALDVARLHEGEVQRRGVKLEVAAHGPVLAHADPRKLKQVLINLLQNALDATVEAGLVRIETERADDRVILRVIDEGPGLDAAVRARLGTPGVTSKPQGSGLGLAMVRACVEQHGGRFELRETPPSGCIAEVDLPERATVASIVTPAGLEAAS